jgi:hypothetical protein
VLGEPLPVNCILQPQNLSISLAKLKKNRQSQLKIPEVLSDEDTHQFTFSQDCTRLLQALGNQEKGLVMKIFQLRSLWIQSAYNLVFIGM